MNHKIESLKKKVKPFLPYVAITASTVLILGVTYIAGRKSAPDQIANLQSQWDAKIAAAPDGDFVLLARNGHFINFTPTE